MHLVKCSVKAPKMVVSDQSLALMSALVQSFTQYDSLEQYLQISFQSVMNTGPNNMPLCYIRNDINHFVKLITQWSPLNKSKFPRTKQLFVRSMTLLIYCTTMEETKKILEAIFKVALSKYDGPLLVRIDNSVETPCAISKKYLQYLISNKLSYLQTFDHLIEENVCVNINDEESNYYENSSDESGSSFMNWALLIANKCKLEIETIEGEYDNAQFIPELVPLIVKAMKLYPCWSGIMRKSFGYGDATVSSSREECNFNQLKNRVFEVDKLPIRVDDFVEKLILYYNGDNLLLQNSKSLTTTSEPSNEVYTEQNVREDNVQSPSSYSI